MASPKLAAVVIVLSLLFLYFVMTSFIAIGFAAPAIARFLSAVSTNPGILVSPENILLTITVSALAVIWLIVLLKFVGSVEDYLGKRYQEERRRRSIDKELDNLGVFIRTAEREFMKRRISKETFDDIQRIAGKKMVELKAKRKEIEEEKSRRAGRL